MRFKSLNATFLSAAALALVLAALPAAAADKPQITVEEHTLSNGMRWLLYEQRDSPTVAAFWTARVGSVNERPGITGISHFFEHMMFKGTKAIGTITVLAVSANRLFARITIEEPALRSCYIFCLRSASTKLVLMKRV